MLRSKHLLKRLGIFIVAIVCPFILVAQANIKPVSSILQQPSSVIKELKIGDIVPDIEFLMVNYSKPTARLSDFKGKVVILDFWATWCGSCIEAFPKIDLAQKEFGDRLQVILVNSRATKDTKD